MYLRSGTRDTDPLCCTTTGAHGAPWDRTVFCSASGAVRGTMYLGSGMLAISCTSTAPLGAPWSAGRRHLFTLFGGVRRATYSQSAMMAALFFTMTEIRGAA